MENGYEIVENFLTKEEHQYYLDICGWDMPIKKKIRIMGELMASCYDDHWRVVGITREALNVFQAHGYKKVPRMGINRGHVFDRKDTLDAMINIPFQDAEEWWEFFYNRDQTILQTSTENMTGKLSETYEVPPGLFHTSGFAWKHGTEEIEFLIGLG